MTTTPTQIAEIVTTCAHYFGATPLDTLTSNKVWPHHDYKARVMAYYVMSELRVPTQRIAKAFQRKKGAVQYGIRRAFLDLIDEHQPFLMSIKHSISGDF
jgi:hypothetical protein